MVTLECTISPLKIFKMMGGMYLVIWVLGNSGFGLYTFLIHNGIPLQEQQ